MALTPEQQAKRAGGFTASFAPYLLRGDQDRIMEEWMRLVDHEDYVAPDFSDNWAVQFGNLIETPALNWHERKTGQPLVRRGEVVNHPEMQWVCCTLDCYRESDRTVIDCKAISAWKKIPDICGFYAPQVIVQRACVGADNMALLIVHGGAEPAEWPVSVTPEYEAEVWQRIAEFWQCVETLTAPYDIKPLEAPVIEAFREIDMQTSNAWADCAFAWLKHRDGAKAFKSAEAELKALVPADGRRCYGHGIVATKAKNGAITIKPGE